MRFAIKVNGESLQDVTALKILVVGRNHDLCNLVISTDHSVSAIHCLISVGVKLAGTPDRVFWIVDGDGSSPSLNGCLLNGNHLIKQKTSRNNCPIFNGDFVNIGNSIIKFYISGEEKLNPKSTTPTFF